MKKLLTILLVVLMAFSFAGCGKEGGGDTPKPADDVKKVVVLLPFTGDNSYFDTLARGVEVVTTLTKNSYLLLQRDIQIRCS